MKITRLDFTEKLKDLLAVERLAKKRYQEDNLTFHNFVIKDTVSGIIVDEGRHISLLLSLVEMLEKRK